MSGLLSAATAYAQSPGSSGEAQAAIDEVIDYFTLDLGSLEPQCGDGIRDPLEDCDGASLHGQSCIGLTGRDGTLHCTASCTFDTSDCTAAVSSSSTSSSSVASSSSSVSTGGGAAGGSGGGPVHHSSSVSSSRSSSMSPSSSRASTSSTPPSSSSPKPKPKPKPSAPSVHAAAPSSSSSVASASSSMASSHSSPADVPPCVTPEAPEEFHPAAGAADGWRLMLAILVIFHGAISLGRAALAPPRLPSA